MHCYCSSCNVRTALITSVSVGADWTVLHPLWSPSFLPSTCSSPLSPPQVPARETDCSENRWVNPLSCPLKLAGMISPLAKKQNSLFFFLFHLLSHSLICLGLEKKNKDVFLLRHSALTASKSRLMGLENELPQCLRINQSCRIPPSLISVFFFFFFLSFLICLSTSPSLLESPKRFSLVLSNHPPL